MKFDICNKKDEWLTPKYAINPILEYIEPKSAPPFSSAYVCSQFLPKLRIFKEIEKRENTKNG